MKKQTGITLIALIITIIVMLILVGVTINVALNGGLIEKAKTAKELTQIQTEKEELISIAISAWDKDKLKVDNTKIVLGEKFELDNKTTTGKIVVKAKETGNLWQIDVASAKVEEYAEPQGVTYKAYLSGDAGWYFIIGSDDSIYMAHEGTVTDYSIYIDGDIKEAIHYAETTLSPYEGDISEYIDLIKNL